MLITIIGRVRAHGVGNEEVEASHAGMAVGGEIEVTVGSEGGEHFVTRGVDRLAEILRGSRLIANELATPDIEASQTTGHVTGEIQPFAVR